MMTASNCLAKGEPIFQDFSFANHWFLVLLLVCVALLILFALVLFFAALLERVRVRPLIPVADDRRPAAAQPLVDSAVSVGFRPLGVFSDGDKGFKEGISSILLMPDGSQLLWIVHSKLAGRKQIITKLADGRWLVTADNIGVVDRSGLRDEEVFPDADIDVLAYAHRRRWAESGQQAVPFAPESVVADFLQHGRDRAARMYEAGLIRYRMDAAQAPAAASQAPADAEIAYSYTLKGAVRVVVDNVAHLGRVMRQQTQTKQLAAELRSTRFNPQAPM
jgi:hypothetical protein